MDTRVARLMPFVPSLTWIIQTFMASKSRFIRLQKIDSKSTWPALPTESSAAVEGQQQQQPDAVRKLYILDSSYNPPSKAHASLALTALKNTDSSNPIRLLLLFSTSNADKGVKPAAFEHRLAMMMLFALDIRDALCAGLDYSNVADTPIDIGLTSEAYYAGKSSAITEEKPLVYDGRPTHVHLMGYDTIVRFLAPRYYAKVQPPLSALQPFFEAGHEVEVLLRPTEGANDGQDIGTQRQYFTELATGDLVEQGFNPEWAKQIRPLENNDASGISSTSIREAASKKDWSTLERMCTPGVASWIQKHGLYGPES